MSILPQTDIPDFNMKVQTSRTYSLNIETGEISGKVDGLEAIKQYVIKAIKTPRFRHVIYSFSYGCEMEELIGQDFTEDFFKSEIQRMIKEALIYDERIEDVHSFTINRNAENIYIDFTVETIEGQLVISEVI